MHLSVPPARGKLRAFAVVALVAAIPSCKESTAPPEPASIAPSVTVVADGTAGFVLATPPTFVVKDADGNSLSGVAVIVVVSAGGGVLTDAPTSTKGSATPVGTWKLGNTAGINSLTVTVGNLPPLVISVNGKAGPPASIAFVAGANQFGLAGTVLPVSPVAQVRDQFGNGVSGTPVTFGIAFGTGTVSLTPVMTDASGNATAPEWRLGKSAEGQSLRAVASGFAANVDAQIQTSYDIDIRFFGPPMPSVATSAFTAAAARISGAVVGDVPNLPAPTSAINLEQCGVTGLPLFQEGVDDVIIYAAVAPIDGPRGILAFAGPCSIRGPFGQPNRQTAIGVMKFDAADLDSLIAQGTLTDVIQHEMIHIVGLGTLWSIYGVVLGAGTDFTRFVGTLGVGACVAIGGGVVCPGSVPVENKGGPGTADGHWRESVFATELMTGFLTRPIPDFTGILNPLSSITIQSLGDIGYVVNPAAADVYTIPGQSPLRASVGVNADNSSTWEQLARPRMEVSRLGKVSAIRMQ